MKKMLFLFLIISSMILTENLYSQDYHSLYQSATGRLFQSFVNMSNPATAETWFVASDDSGKIIVMQMDFSYPTPQPQNIWAFTLTMPSIAPNPAIGQIYLKDGFFDPEGNIFVYGFEETSKRGIYAKIFFTNNAPTTLIWAFINESNTQITDACWANGFNAASTMNYGIIYGDAFARIKGSLNGNLTFLGIRKSLLKFTSVSYDQSENKFVISGNSGNYEPNQFIGTIENNSSLPNIPSMPVKYLSLEDTLNTYLLSENTNKHVLSGSSNGIAYLIQDIRDNSGDGFWVSEVNYLTGAVNWSKIYKFPPEKVNIINVAHNYINLYVLGHHNGFDQNNNSFERRYIAQIDLSNPQNYIVKLMRDENWWGTSMPSTYYSIEQMYLSSLNFNEATYNIYASGATPQGDAYLVEINDLMYETCDIDRLVTTPSFVCDCYDTISALDFIPYNSSRIKCVSTPTTYSINDTLLCGDDGLPKMKNEELKAKIENKKLENTAFEQIEKETKITPNIKIYEKSFLCNNFGEVCNYKIFDVLGRKLQEGNTHNDTEIEINIKTAGTYLLNISDNKGNVKTEKLIIK